MVSVNVSIPRADKPEDVGVSSAAIAEYVRDIEKSGIESRSRKTSGSTKSCGSQAKEKYQTRSETNRKEIGSGKTGCQKARRKTGCQKARRSQKARTEKTGPETGCRP